MGRSGRISTRLLAGILATLLIGAPKPTSATTVTVPDPILQVGFDEGSGLIADDAAPGDHDVTLDGPQWVDGQSGKALRFDGSGDRATIAGNGLHHEYAISLSFWVRSSGVDPADGAVVLEAGASGCGQASFGVYATADGIAVKPPSSGALAWDPTFYTGIDIWDGSWHHVAAVWGVMVTERLFVDGFELGGSGPYPDFATETVDDISIGASLAGAGCSAPTFRGEIDDLRMWSVPLEREHVGSLLPPVATTVTISQPGVVHPISYEQCVQVAVSPVPAAGVVRIQVRDDQGMLVGSGPYGGCPGWPDPPQGTWNVPILVSRAGSFTMTAFYDPAPPWLASQSAPMALSVQRIDVGMQLSIDSVMPNMPIVASTRMSFTDTVDRTGTVELVETTGGGEVVVASTEVASSPSSSVGAAVFTLPGRPAGDYTFFARYEGTPDLWAPSASAEATVVVDDTLGSRGPITFGTSPTYWTGDVLDVYAPADNALYVEVREPGGQWFRQGYNLPVIYPLNTFAATPADGPITIEVRWQDDGGRWSEIQSKTLLLDRTDPAVASTGSPINATTAASGSVPVRVRWSAKDATSGVATSDVQVSVNGMPYTTVTSKTTGTSLAQRIRSGDTFRYRMRTRDKAGNASGWVYDRTLRPTAYSEVSSIVRYAGTWAYAYPSDAIGDRVRTTATAGSKASVTFSGRSFGWVATMGPTRGKAAVYVGSTRVATVDLWAPTTRYRQVVFTRSWSTTSSRTVTIKALGTTGRSRIDIDGILVVR